MSTDDKKQAAQTAREEKIIANVKVCSVPTSAGLVDVNAKAVETKLEGDFYSAGLLEALACYFDVTFHEGAGEEITKAPRGIHKLLTHARKIGAASVEGVALLTGVKDVDDLIIIKAPQDPKEDGLVHEYFVAVTCLNALRRRCPGFMYAFEAFRCSAPIIKGKQVLSWCKPSGPSVNYVVFEKISPGKSIADLMPTLSTKEYISYFIQLCFNEMIAVETCSWTHNDAHAGNVLPREVKGAKGRWFWVPFVLAGGRVVYVQSNRVPTFIDYGRAHVKYQGKHYGYFAEVLLKEIGLYPDQCRPLYDMYRLLGWSLWACLGDDGKGFASQGARELFRGLQPLFSFFRDVTSYPQYLATVRREVDTYYTYSVRITQAEKDSSLQDLLAHVEEQYPEISL
jgi:hypothetical protein